MGSRFLRVSRIVVGLSASEYRGEHEAPGKEGAPLHDLTQNGIYPEDIYFPQAFRQYSDGSRSGNSILDLAYRCKGRPRERVWIYRAVPKVETNTELIRKYEKHKGYILRNGKMPPDADIDSKAYKDFAANHDYTREHSKYYDYILEELDRLYDEPDTPVEKMEILPGDWVTLDRQYAVEHGKGNLKGKYRILSKVVLAKDVYTNGDGLSEWGWSP